MNRWKRSPRCTSATATSRRSSSRVSFPTRATTAPRWRRSPTRPRESAVPGQAVARRGTARPLAGVGIARRHRRDQAADCGMQAVDAGRWGPGSAQPQRLVAGAGRSRRTDLGGLTANGDHIFPEEPFPSPHQVKRSWRRGVRADRAALRLPAVHGHGLDGAGRPRRDQAQVLELHPAARQRAPLRRGSGRRVAPRAIEKGRQGIDAFRGRADRAVRGDAAGGDRGDADRRRRAARGTGRRRRHLRRQPQHQFTNICVVGCAFCGFGQGSARPTPTSRRARLRLADRRSCRLRRHRALHAGRHPSGPDPGGVRPLADARQGDGAAAAPPRLLADGDQPRLRTLRQRARGSLRIPARMRARSTPGTAARCSTTASASGFAEQAPGRRAGSRSSKPPTGPGCARPRP